MKKISQQDWSLLLAIKAYVQTLENIVEIFVSSDQNGFTFSEKPILENQWFMYISSESVEIKNDPLFSKNTYHGERQSNFKYYLSFIQLYLKANAIKECQIIAHFAQSLDGHIATKSFDAQWIGNNENLIHAHRMRALCDGIMVGARTAILEKPQLNVRKVDGLNPKRFVFSTRMDNKKKIEALGYSLLYFDKTDKEKIRRKELKRELYQMGIKTLYLEGGSNTTSLLIDIHFVDVLQLHIAPILIGGGIPALQIRPIDHLKDSLSFKKIQYLPVGNHIMFEGYL